MVFDQIFATQRLIGEAHIHHRRGVTLCSGEVYQPAFSQQVDSPAVGSNEFLYEWPNFPAAHRGGHQRRDVDFNVEVPAVGNDGPRPALPQNDQRR